MHSRLRAAVFFIGLGLGAQGSNAASWSEAKAVRAQEMVEHFLTPRGRSPIRPPGLSVAIGLGGELVFARGAGSAGLGRHAAADTVYRIGSLTKQFTAAAVLRMIEKGAVAPRSGAPLTLDTKIDDIFEGTEDWQVEGQNAITLRTLLNMTSNLPNFTRRPPDEVDPWGTVQAAMLLRQLKKQKPSGWPGTFEYSNTSYFLLAEALEAARWENGLPRAYEQVLQTELFVPIGMPSTAFTGYRADRMAIPAYHRRAAFSDRDWLKGSGDAASTVVDLHTWNAALMDGRVLSSHMRDEMFREGGRVTPTIYYGMGWFIQAADHAVSYYHTGSVPGFTSYNGITVPAGAGPWISVTVLTNSDGVEGLEELAADLTYLVSAE